MARLCCPNCKSPDDLGTLEKISAISHAAGMSRDEDGSIGIDYAGHTDFDWDSSETFGGVCRACGWAWEDSDWGDHLDIWVEHDEEEPVDPEEDGPDPEEPNDCCPHCYSPEDWEYIGTTNTAKCLCGATWTAA